MNVLFEVHCTDHDKVWYPERGFASGHALHGLITQAIALPAGFLA
jgi:hypothetical protein